MEEHNTCNPYSTLHKGGGGEIRIKIPLIVETIIVIENKFKMIKKLFFFVFFLIILGII